MERGFVGGEINGQRRRIGQQHNLVQGAIFWIRVRLGTEGIDVDHHKKQVIISDKTDSTAFVFPYIVVEQSKSASLLLISCKIRKY